MVRTGDIFGKSGCNSPHVLSHDDCRAMSQLVGYRDPAVKKSFAFEDIYAHTTKYAHNDLVKDTKLVVNQKVNSYDFEKGMLREGTILRRKGFVITDKGKKVDPALLNKDDLKDRFEL